MTEAWAVVAAVGIGTVLIKGAGPVLLGGRSLPPRVAAIVGRLAPALLAALVVTAGVSSGSALVADARLIGLAVAAIALLVRAPVLVVVGVAAAAAAIARLFGVP